MNNRFKQRNYVKQPGKVSWWNGYHTCLRIKEIHPYLLHYLLFLLKKF